MAIFLVNDKYKYIIISYRKSGGSTIRLMHLYLTYPDESHGENFEDRYHDIQNLYGEEIIEDQKYSSYFKVVIYRNPYDRLCSTYFQFIIGIKGENNIRNGKPFHLSPRRPDAQDEVSTFNKFLNWLIYNDGINLDAHYYPQKLPAIYDKVINISEINTIFDSYSENLSTIVRTYMNDKRKCKLNFLPKLLTNNEYKDLSNYNFIKDPDNILINGNVPPYEYLLSPSIKNFIKENYKDDFL